MSLGRKKQKTKKKKQRQHGGRKTLKKHNRTKNRRQFQIGGSIKPIMGNLLYILEKDNIEFLPSSRLLEIDMMHYLKMIDYHKLENIIDNNPEYKESPTIQELFNYEAIGVDENDKITFDTSKINCKDILDKTHKTYYLRVLFFYLLECNITRDNILSGGGDEPQIISDKELLKLKEPPSEPDGGKNKDLNDPQPVKEPVKEPVNPGEILNEPINPGEILNEPVPEENQDNMGYPVQETILEGEPQMIDAETIDIVEQQELPGFSEYEKLRDNLDMNDEMVKDDKKIPLMNSNFVFHDTNWFNVCMGVDELDILFEDKVSAEIKDLGFSINKEKLNEKIKELLEDEYMKKSFHSALHKRLLDCSKKPQTFLDRILRKVSFKSCVECDMKDKGSILYLYDEYKSILNQNTSKLNKIDLTIILIFCEIRQRLLSYHIAMEVLRRNRTSKSDIHSLLKKIYKLDLPIIKQKSSELNQRRVNMLDDVKQKNKEKDELIKGQKEMMENNKEARNNFNEDMDEVQIGKFKEKFILDNNQNNDFIKKMNNNLDEMDDNLEDELELEMKGGSEITEEMLNDNVLSKLYNMNNLKNKNRCESMRNIKNIKLDDLQYINNCDNL
jgi:hypothetical protein